MYKANGECVDFFNLFLFAGWEFLDHFLLHCLVVLVVFIVMSYLSHA